MKKVRGIITSRIFVFFAIIGLQAWFYIALAMGIADLHPAINITITVVSIMLAFYLIYKNQDPTYKLVWIMAICLLPVFGILMYFFFSQRKMGRKLRRELKSMEQESVRYLEQEDQAFGEIVQADKGIARLSEYIRETRYFPIYGDTETTYFDSGESFFEQLVEELQNAKRYIFMEFFVIKAGYMSNTILDILKKKAAEGVEVRFMYDDMGCIFELPLHFDRELKKHGIKCVVFNKIRPALNSLFNNRDHRKIVIIDGHTSFVSGANIADEYINRKERFGHWKDACLMMKGKASWGFLIMFLQLWDSYQAVHTDVELLKPLPDEMTGTAASGYVQPFDDSPLHDINVCERVYLNIIGRAKDYLYLTTPYLIPNDALMNAITSAAISGVDVRITVPHIPDKKAVFYVTRSSYKQLIESGVRIYEYTPGFMHAKTLVSDDDLAIVGTINLDYRSLFLHFECAALLYKTSTVTDVKKDYLDTLEVCEEITLEKVNGRPWHTRFIEMVFGIFAPLF